MVKIIKNTFKLLFRKKSLLVGIILIPTILTFVFSFLLGSEMKYGVGIVNKDNDVASEYIIKTLKDMGNINITSLDENKVDSALVGKEIEVAIIFPENYTESLVKGTTPNIPLKSVSDSEIKATLSSVINSKTSILSSLGKMANGDKEKFSTLISDYKNSDVKYELNEENKKGVQVFSSIGMVIMIIFTTSFFIARFVIDDEISGTKDRILLGKVSKIQYFGGRLISFYICSCITSILYYSMCNILGFDFGTTNQIYYLYILFSLNFLAIAFNLALISISKNPAVAANISAVLVTSLSMISGLFWPFSFMPDVLQTIGGFIPTRWAMVALEDVVSGATFVDILPTIISIIVTGILLLVVTVVISSKKKSIKR